MARWGTAGGSDDAGGTTLKKQPVEGGCEGCGAAHDGSFASGRFCSKPCAARNNALRKWHGEDQSPQSDRHAQKKPKKRGKKRKKRSAETDSAESAKPPRSAPRERAVPKPKVEIEATRPCASK